MIDKEQKLKLFAIILKLGHEAFDKPSKEALFSHIVNHSRALTAFQRSAIIEIHPNKVEVNSVSAQTEINPESEYIINLKSLSKYLKDIKEKTHVTLELLDKLGANGSAIKALEQLTDGGKKNIYATPLPPSPKDLKKRKEQITFIWLLEYQKELSDFEQTIIKMLSLHYREAIWYHYSSKPSENIVIALFKAIFDIRTFTIKKIVFLLAIIFAISLYKIKVPETATGEFEVIPMNYRNIYAPFSGFIESTNVINGDTVHKGDIIMKYDTEELRLELLKLSKELDVLSIKIEISRKVSFYDVRKRGEVILLEQEKRLKELDLQKVQWYLSKSEIRAPFDGVVMIDDKNTMFNKSITPGEKLCEIFSTNQKKAYIYLPESSATVLNGVKKINIYLHSQPEKTITAKIISISPKPVLTDVNYFCYLIEAEIFAENDKEILRGMRGVAKIYGKQVTLGYYLFKNLILFWRRV
jgi:hypothetical protein